MACSSSSASNKPTRDPNAVPEGLTASDWNGIRAAHEAARLAVTADDHGGYRAWNPGQQWRTAFDGRGFLTRPEKDNWSWGLELHSYGFAGHERTFDQKAVVKAEGQRLVYQRDEELSEWYVNDQGGLEHGFTLTKRPEGAGDTLQFTLSVRGNLRPEISKDGIRFIDQNGASVINYTNLHAWDADGKRLPARFVAEKEGFSLSIEEAGARYPLTIDPIAQQAYLKASNSDTNDLFGRSVAISGDTVVVGAYLEDSASRGVNGNEADNTATDSGAAYVFVRSGNRWTQQAYLKASNSEANDIFGYSVAISGDTVVVGAYLEDSASRGINGNEADNTASASGAAYVFVRSGNSWTQQAYLKASNSEAGDEFGHSVAISGETVVVGAEGEDSAARGVNGNEADNSASSSGAAYVFVRSGNSWAQQAYLKASNSEASDLFGFFVAISGDTVVVGAYAEASASRGVNGNEADNTAPDSGAAYVFVRSGTSWAQQAYLKASNSEAGDSFGFSVAISGDTVVVGADFEASASRGVNGNEADNTAPDSGAAYVFVRSGTSWAQQAYLKASNSEASDFFGHSVAISGNIVVVGAYGEASATRGVNGDEADNTAPNSGAAYVFVRSGNSWTQQAYLKASNCEAGDFFGIRVAISGDTAVVGADFEDSAARGVNGNEADNTATNSGAAYILSGLVGGRLQNISTRAQALTGDQVTIGGFIISGSEEKNVLIRALGPTLAQPPFNVAGTLADPLLELHDGTGALLVTNNNWKDSQQAEIEATGKAPPNDRESAILASLAPGNYTAIMKGNNGGTGVGLVEVYDVDSISTSLLSNISTRGAVGTGDNVMIAGVIAGPGTGLSQNVLMRALGPTLAQSPFNVPGTLVDPTLELHDKDGMLITSNDNWKDSQEAQIEATGKAPPNDSESAILTTLTPGNYTAIVKGKNNTTGIALVEVYNVP